MEQAWLEHLAAWGKKHIAKHIASCVEVGIGDDAAVLAPTSRRIVVTTDALTEGVDFCLATDDTAMIGRKSLAVNLSDIAAMGAEPLAAVVAVVLPRHNASEIADLLWRGIAELAAEYNVALVGGDTNTWDGGLVVTITLLGLAQPHGVWLRSGAVPGDRILVTGSLGGSILGHQFTFTPRIREARFLGEHAIIHAAIDISDGLSLDLARLATASKCGSVIDVANVPIADAAKKLATKKLDCDPLTHALTDGEDFELLLAVPPEEATKLIATQPLCKLFGTTLTDIGECATNSGQWLRQADGTLQSYTPRGYQHSSYEH